MRASCIALLTVVALATSRAPAPGVEIEGRREARQAPDRPDGAVVVSPRRSPEIARHGCDVAILPGPIVVPAPPRPATAVEHGCPTSAPRIVEIPPRSRAPPLGTDRVI